MNKNTHVTCIQHGHLFAEATVVCTKEEWVHKCAAFGTFYLRGWWETTTLPEHIESPHKRRLQCAPPIYPPLIQFQQQF